MIEVLDRDVYQTPQGKIFMTDDGKLRELAERVMKSNSGILKHTNLDDVEFVIVEGSKEPWLGKAVKVAPMYRLFLKKKFLILFNATMISATAPNSLDKVMVHELYHVNSTVDALNDHNVEDFSFMLTTYGVDWRNNNKGIIPKDELMKLAPWSMSGTVTTAAGLDKTQ